MNSLLISSMLLFSLGFFNLLGISQPLAFTQLFNLAVALAAYAVTRKVGRNFFRLNHKFFYWLFVGVLLVTFMVGLEVKGSKRWLDLGFFNFQASEFFKVFFIIFFAAAFSRLKKVKEWLGLLGQYLLLAGLPAFIILKQPDLGNAIIFASIFGILLLLSPIPKRYIIYLTVIALLVLPVFWHFMHDYQRDRILSFINPTVNSQGSAYNVTQSVITVGSGGMLGRGLGLGTQARLYYLPENKTDFAFASLSEQFGFAVAAAAVCAFAVIILYLVKKAVAAYYRRSEDGGFDFYYVCGLIAFAISQIFINIGMNMGIFPVAGVALPLISYGGSALITWFMAVALLP